MRLSLGEYGCEISSDSVTTAPVGTYGGAPLAIGFETRYLIDALAGAEGNVVLRFGDAIDSIRVETSAELLRIVMPKRL